MRTWAWDVGEGNASSTGQLSTVMTDLFHTAADDPATGDHNWALFITDILDVKGERAAGRAGRVTQGRRKEKNAEEGCWRVWKGEEGMGKGV